MSTSRTEALADAGVSIWLDDLSRGLIASGDLAALVRDRNVTGVTTNPTIFAAALAHGDAYRAQVAQLATAGTDLQQAVTTLTTDDVRAAADVLRPVYDRTGGEDGRVSIEVSPDLARDTDGTVAQARELWARVDRPNVLIKVPATVEGLPAITTLIGEGISVNVTLIFSIDRYWEVVVAYLAGLEQAQQAGLDLGTIRSVASFFVSRVDSAVDARLDAIGSPAARELRGKAAVANARLAYQVFQRVFAEDRAQRLLAAGAHRQRPLWASTGVKDPHLPDTYYVTELVAPGTVTTVPRKTLEAIADHGEIEDDTITPHRAEASAVLGGLSALGVALDEVTEQLEAEGVAKFVASWRELEQTVSESLSAASRTPRT